MNKQSLYTCFAIGCTSLAASQAIATPDTPQVRILPQDNTSVIIGRILLAADDPEIVEIDVQAALSDDSGILSRSSSYNFTPPENFVGERVETLLEYAVELAPGLYQELVSVFVYKLGASAPLELRFPRFIEILETGAAIGISSEEYSERVTYVYEDVNRFGMRERLIMGSAGEYVSPPSATSLLGYAQQVETGDTFAISSDPESQDRVQPSQESP